MINSNVGIGQMLIICHISLYQIKANGTLMQLVGADWLRSDRREDNLSGRPGGIVQVWFVFLVTQVCQNCALKLYVLYLTRVHSI